MRQAWLGAMLLTALCAGCVERRYVVTSEPPGALVLRNGVPIGLTPVDDFFIYYGSYDLTLIKDGYETLPAKVKIDAPWYQYPPLDFVAGKKAAGGTGARRRLPSIAVASPMRHSELAAKVVARRARGW